MLEMEHKSIIQLLGLLLILLVLAPGNLRGQSVDIHEFVKQEYIHGIPEEDAKLYGEAALPDLHAMLQSPLYEPYRTNIIATLGAIGSTCSIEPLLNYFQQLEGEISYSTFQSTLSLFQTMGILARTGNDTPIDFLVPFTNPTYWQESDYFDFTFENYSKKTLGHVYARIAMQGLGISGHPKALVTLKELEKKLLAQEIPADWSDNIEEALEFHQFIRNQ